MHIESFASIVEETAIPHTLKKGSHLVIDARNFFYDCYKNSKLSFEFGAECDRYAEYLKNIYYLNMLKNQDIKCYFIFKGGSKEYEKKISELQKETEIKNTNLVRPKFMDAIHMQVVKEMGFHYVFTMYESKLDCITLARKLSCPVLSNDIEFPLSGVQYIPKDSLDIRDGEIHCRLLKPDTVLQKYELDKNKIALFILLTDKSLFSGESFHNFLKSIGISIGPKKRNEALLRWLSSTSEEETLKRLIKETTIEEDEIKKALEDVKTKVKGEVNSEMASEYFFNKHKITDWFTRGVAANYIDFKYIDVYQSHALRLQLYNKSDFRLLSFNIIKYAYDLLTDFKNKELKVIMYACTADSTKESVLTETIKKPSCQSYPAIFEYDCDNMASYRLFEHFISETIPFDWGKLEKVREDAKMLMITLVYIFHKSSSDSNCQNSHITFTSEMAFGVLLSYVMLGVVKERLDNTNDDKSITISDCKSALQSLQEYFNVEDVNDIMNINLRDSLKQIQNCLLEMNNLNKLCGSRFEPTTYRKTYNGTFIYKIIYSMQNEGIIRRVTEILSCAPTVLKCFEEVTELYLSLIKSD